MLEIDPEQKSQEIIGFIQKTFKDAGFSRAVIGLSGGLDSATSCVLSLRALGKENVYPVLMPYGSLSMQGTLDAMTFAQTLQIPLGNISRIDIRPSVDDLIKNDPGMDNVRRGNLMARMRMIVLFDQAKKRTALVVGTENKSEYLLGYYTRYGDEASDIEPLRNLYKTQVYQLAKHLGLPDEILKKPPTAGLWPGQTDEGEFGFTYGDADLVLSLLYDDKLTIEQVIEKGLDRSVVEAAKERVDRNAFKKKLPYIR